MARRLRAPLSRANFESESADELGCCEEMHALFAVLFSGF
jgi:hypothetical protein